MSIDMQLIIFVNRLMLLNPTWVLPGVISFWALGGIIAITAMFRWLRKLQNEKVSQKKLRRSTIGRIVWLTGAQGNWLWLIILPLGFLWPITYLPLAIMNWSVRFISMLCKAGWKLYTTIRHAWRRTKSHRHPQDVWSKRAA